MKKIIHEYLTFSKKDQIAITILLTVIAVFIAMPYLITTKRIPPTIDEDLQKQIALMQNDSNALDSRDSFNRQYSKANYTNNYNKENSVFEPFVFDPNMVDEEGWKKLGLRDKTIKTILNYRAKGGKFYKAEDIKKIWGLRPEEADRLMPYIQITSTKNAFTPYTKSVSLSPTKPTILDINTATPIELKALPAMDGGSNYRIVKFREKLGGFISINQVKETYGLSDSAFTAMLPYFKLENPIIKKININTATDIELNEHPYIDKPVAKAILLYRTQYGNYKTVADIKKIIFIKEQLYQKIAPYLTVD